MIFIAHRGLTNGPDSLRENTPDQIIKCINEGFVPELDIWLYQGNWWTGHNEPSYLLTKEHRENLSKSLDRLKLDLLSHMKNKEALDCFSTARPAELFNYFWHDRDRYTISSQGWVIENINEQEPANNSIINQPELHDFFHDDSHLTVPLAERFLRRYGMKARGVMTKYPRIFREAWNNITGGEDAS